MLLRHNYLNDNLTLTLSCFRKPSLLLYRLLIFIVGKGLIFIFLISSHPSLLKTDLLVPKGEKSKIQSDLTGMQII